MLIALFTILFTVLIGGTDTPFAIPDADKIISQDSIIVSGFICQSRQKDPNAKGKYIERTILDPINFKPIDSLTLKPLKEGEY